MNRALASQLRVPGVGVVNKPGWGVYQPKSRHCVSAGFDLVFWICRHDDMIRV